MPTYEYRREDGTTFEVQQRITEDALETCPETGQKVTRLISGGTGLIFKGSGFYLTDYTDYGKGESRNGDEKKSKDGEKASGDKPAAKGTSGESGEKKSAAKTETKSASE